MSVCKVASSLLFTFLVFPLFGHRHCYSYCTRPLYLCFLSAPFVFPCREGRCHPLSLKNCLATTRERRCISPRLTSPDPVPAQFPMVEIIEVDCFRNAAEERARLGLSADSFDEDEIATGIAYADRLAADAYNFSGHNSYPNNIPLIALAQPNGPQYIEQEGSLIDDATSKRPLSRITEKTEISDISYARPMAQETAYNQMVPSLRSSTSTSSYGEVIGEYHVSQLLTSLSSLILLLSESKLGMRAPRMSFESTHTIPDPNDIPPSPSPSAWQPLPNQTPSVPSAVSSGSRTPDTIPARPPSVPLPPLDLIPEMPDNQSRTTRVRSPEHENAIPVQVFRNGSSKRVTSPKRTLSPPVDVDKPLPPPPPPSEPRYSVAQSIATTAPTEPQQKKPSKLSTLATSRAASTRLSTVTKSSRLSASSIGGTSILTYPALRPSNESIMSMISEEARSESGSSTDTIVRRAIQTALDQEAEDRDGQNRPEEPAVASSKLSSSTSSQSTVRPAPSSASHSKLQARAAASSVASSEAPKSTQKSTQPSKLAMYAQSKAKPYAPKPKAPPRPPSPNSLLHSTTTEYLTPIANGPTATTAITTSYQTLNHLISPAKSALPPSFPPHDYKPAPGLTSSHIEKKTTSSLGEPKQSKLAMKAKKSQAKPEVKEKDSVEEMEDEKAWLPVPTIFLPEASRSCASPSKFASLLVDDNPLTSTPHPSHSSQVKKHRKGEKETTLEDREKSTFKEHRHHRTGSRSRSRSRTRHASEEGTERSKSVRKHRSTKHSVPAPSAPAASTGAKGVPFAFDSPSPDDIVFNARKGTSLARSQSTASIVLPPSTVPSRGPSSVASTVKRSRA